MSGTVRSSDRSACWLTTTVCRSARRCLAGLRDGRHELERRCGHRAARYGPPSPSFTTPAAAWAIPATSEDPATQILDLAAQHRSWRWAGSPLAIAEPPPTAPAIETNWAPAPAQDLLGRLLDHPEPDMINYWLAACVDRRHHVWPEHWQLLAELATGIGGVRPATARSSHGRPAVSGFSIRTLPGPVWRRRSPPQCPTKQPAPTRCQNRCQSALPPVQLEIDAVFTGSDHE